MSNASRLLLAALLMTPCLGAPVPALARDPQIACGDTRSGGPTTNDVFSHWLEASTPAISPDRTTSTKTNVGDVVTYDFSASRIFPGFAGGGGGSRAFYDPQHRLLAVCRQFDTSTGFYLFSNMSPPPFAIDHRDLTSFKTHGVGLGSTAATVREAFGPESFRALSSGTSGLAYVHGTPNADASGYAAVTWFRIVNDRVVGIGQETGY